MYSNGYKIQCKLLQDSMQVTPADLVAPDAVIDGESEDGENILL